MRTGRATKNTLLLNTASSGIASGFTSLRQQLSPPGSLKFSSTLLQPMLLVTYILSPVLRQGSASIFQMVLHKNLNGYHRINGIDSHTSLHFTPAKTPS